VPERYDADVIVTACCICELPTGRQGIRKRPAAHGLRAVEREDDALRLAEVDRLEVRNGVAVLPEHRRAPALRRHIRDPE
jgi:hypothetical protein